MEENGVTCSKEEMDMKKAKEKKEIGEREKKG